MQGTTRYPQAPGMPGRWILWLGVLAVLALSAMGGEPRDIVFDCPCRAEWTAGQEGDAGTLTLTLGVGSFRATGSGELRLTDADPETQRTRQWPSDGLLLGTIPAGSSRSEDRRSMPYDVSDTGKPIGLWLWEKAAQPPASVSRSSGIEGKVWRPHEMLVLWPVGDAAADGVEFVDMLTDTDGDGVGDVNETLAGTSRTDPTATPGDSTLDVLALYNAGFREALDSYPYTRIQHVIALTSAVYADSRTNLRMRLVGVREVELDESGVPPSDQVKESLERHGADLHFRFHGDGPMGCPPGAGGCASVGAFRRSGYWPGDGLRQSVCMLASSALCPAHELGHNLGLAHSARQGEAYGAFRWSRGHFLDERQGTVMSYGSSRIGVFSDPGADCGGVPCGMPIDRAGGAHAVRSLDLVRFQAAAHRGSKPDTDGDGIVDLADALPEDPDEWVDSDGDGVGDNADADDDGDGVGDAEDPFPYDPTEWEDADQDGIGDNADDVVTDLSPFRDAALRAAVETVLRKDAGAPITAEDLATLVSLTARRSEIRHLDGLELTTNLERLDLAGNEVADLSPLAELSLLSYVDVTDNRIGDLTPLTSMVGLRHLWLTGNPLPGLSTVRELRRLETLAIGSTDREIPGASVLAELTNLRRLDAVNLGIDDLSELSGLTRLTVLRVPDNPVADLSPLRELPPLWWLDLQGTQVSDLSPLSDHSLTVLDVGRTGLTLEDVARLPRSGVLRTLGLRETGLEDLSLLSQLPRLVSLNLADNRVGDLSPLEHLPRLRWLNVQNNDFVEIAALGGLAELTGASLRSNRIEDIGPLGSLSGLTWLDLSINEVSDISPLVRREVWDLDAGGVRLQLYENPLDHPSYDEHIPTLESWGITVGATPRPAGEDPAVEVSVPDPALRALVSQAVAFERVWVDDPVTDASIARLTSLRAFNAGVAGLAGLEAAVALEFVFLGGNLVSDLGPLAALPELEGLDLSHNLVSDVTPLVDNPNVDEGDWITLTGNPLSEESLNVHVPALRDRGVHVGVDSVRLLVSPDTRGASFDVSSYFEATAGPNADLAVTGDESDAVRAELVDGVLGVSLGAVEGPTTVNVTATESDGTTETLAFEVSVRQVLALFPSAATPAYQGFVRVTNHSPKPGRAVIHATDDAGRRAGSVTLSLGPYATAPFNSQDLEHGNAAKGLSAGVGTGTGDWRLDFGSNLDIEVLGYARTADGFVTTLHELAARTGDERTLPFLNPGSNTAQVSRLRLVNPGAETAEVTVTGVDDRGRSPGSAVRISVPPRTARTLTAADLEAGVGTTGVLGDGSGKWRLAVTSPQPLYAISLLESPTGHLTNLSGGPVPAAGGTHTVPLFPAAGDPAGRQGFVRVVNRADRAGTVTIAAVDDAGEHHGSATLALGAAATAPFNSDDLEQGNPDKGLTGGVGAGTGAWRLALTADVAIDVYGYIRTTDGFVTSMHDAAPVRDTHHRIAFLNPGGNRAQVSSLRLINPGDRSASATITGHDDGGKSPGGSVRLTVPAGAARTYSAAQLEQGATGLRGALGDGAGKWRLTVESSEPVLVMSLLASPTGHLTNLSTAPMR